jgi:hypothetical protein
MRQAPENKDEPKRHLVGWKYKGGGWIPGVPARDISLDEAKLLDIRERLDESDLYERIWKAGPAEKETK